MTADFQRVYGLRLADALDDRSPGELRALIDWLPDDSAFYAAKQGGHEYFGWGMDRYMQAALVNEARIGNYYVVAVNSKKGAPVKEPAYFPLPGASAKVADERKGKFERLKSAARTARSKTEVRGG